MVNSMFCPFMSTDDKKVDCSRECAFYVPDKGAKQCSLFSAATNMQMIRSEIETLTRLVSERGNNLR